MHRGPSCSKATSKSSEATNTARLQLVLYMYCSCGTLTPAWELLVLQQPARRIRVRTVFDKSTQVHAFPYEQHLGLSLSLT